MMTHINERWAATIGIAMLIVGLDAEVAAQSQSGSDYKWDVSARRYYVRPSSGVAEYVYAPADDSVRFQGAGGSDNTDFNINLDGTYPVCSSDTDTKIGVDDDLEFVGAQAIRTSAGDLSLIPTGDVVVTPTGGDVTITGAMSLTGAFSPNNLSVTGGVTATAMLINGTAHADGGLNAGATDAASLNVVGDAAVGNNLGVTGAIAGASAAVVGTLSGADGGVSCTDAGCNINGLVDAATGQFADANVANLLSAGTVDAATAGVGDATVGGTLAVTGAASLGSVDAGQGNFTGGVTATSLSVYSGAATISDAGVYDGAAVYVTNEVSAGSVDANTMNTVSTLTTVDLVVSGHVDGREVLVPIHGCDVPTPAAIIFNAGYIGVPTNAAATVYCPVQLKTGEEVTAIKLGGTMDVAANSIAATFMRVAGGAASDPTAGGSGVATIQYAGATSTTQTFDSAYTVVTGGAYEIHVTLTGDVTSLLGSKLYNLALTVNTKP